MNDNPSHEKRRNSVGDLRRRRILLFVNEYKEQRDYSPNNREICEAVGIRSTSVAAYHLERMKTDGVLDYVPMQARTVHLTRAGKELIKEMLKARRADDGETLDWLNGLRQSYLAEARS